MVETPAAAVARRHAGEGSRVLQHRHERPGAVHAGRRSWQRESRVAIHAAAPGGASSSSSAPSRWAAPHGLEVAVCGEMASQPLMAFALIGLGVRQLSVAPRVGAAREANRSRRQRASSRPRRPRPRSRADNARWRRDESFAAACCAAASATRVPGRRVARQSYVAEIRSSRCAPSRRPRGRRFFTSPNPRDTSCPIDICSPLSPLPRVTPTRSRTRSRTPCSTQSSPTTHGARRMRDARHHRSRLRCRRDHDDDLRRHPEHRPRTIERIGYTDATYRLRQQDLRGHQHHRQAVARHRAGCGHRRRRRPGNDVRLRDGRDR